MFVRLKDVVLLDVSKVDENDFHQIFLLNFRNLNFFMNYDCTLLSITDHHPQNL